MRSANSVLEPHESAANQPGKPQPRSLQERR
jgi:hypothetical protein